MAGKKVLVVTTTIVDEQELRDALAGADEVRVVSPAAKVSRLAWLTGAEDDARSEADRAALAQPGAVGGVGPDHGAARHGLVERGRQLLVQPPGA